MLTPSVDRSISTDAFYKIEKVNLIHRIDMHTTPVLKPILLFLLWLPFYHVYGHDTRMTKSTINFSKGKVTMNTHIFGDDLQNALTKH